MPAPDKSIRPSSKPPGGPTTQIPTTLMQSGRDVRVLGSKPATVDISQTTNPVTQLGQMQGSQFRVLSTKPLTVMGVHLKTPEGELGGSVPRNADTTGADLQRYFESKFDLDPLRRGEIGLAANGLDEVTGSHEFMHRGFDVLRELGRETLVEELGPDVADLILGDNHPLIQAFMQSMGKEDHDYMARMTDEEKQLVFRAVTPISQYAVKVLLDHGFQPPPTKAEPGEQEAQRKLAKFTEAKSFLEKLLGLF